MIRNFIIRISKIVFRKQNAILALSRENQWANYYHDSIRGVEFLEKLSLNIGGWAPGYPFFYLLHRVLNDIKPSNLELGLGESSKFISTYIEHNLTNTQHIIIEQSGEWKDLFLGKFKLSKKSSIDVCKLTQINVKGVSSLFLFKY